MTKYAVSNITGIRLLKTFISVLLLLVSSSSIAEDMRYYDVEVVVIENLSEEQKKSENWPIQVNLTLPEKTVKYGESVSSEWLPANVDLKSSYKILSPKTYQLTPEIEKIAESKTHRVIFHTAWRQPGLDNKQALPVYFKREIPAAPPQEVSTSAQDADTETSVSESHSTSSILEGLLRVTLARYLHLEAELTYRATPPPVIQSDNPFSVLDNETEREAVLQQGVIHLKQDRRRMRSNELHYLDHPVLSILVKITPYEENNELADKKK